MFAVNTLLFASLSLVTASSANLPLSIERLAILAFVTEPSFKTLVSTALSANCPTNMVASCISAFVTTLEPKASVPTPPVLIAILPPLISIETLSTSAFMVLPT